MGTWAAKHLAGMSDEELRLYEKLLNKETVDVYNILLGKEPVTPDIDNHITKKLIKFVSNSPLGRADPRDYEQIKKAMSN
jgi:succinate dehydrogenase flavin-adding protein (antitoxin of CptAB toxin-antitoxin module)